LSKRTAARKAARRYFDLACHYASGLPPAMLVITCGLPGSGKSTLAKSVAVRLGSEVISSDIVRKEQAGLAPEKRRHEAFGRGIYDADSTERTYAELLRRARSLLLEGHSVVLDASFIRRSHRKAAARLAKETGAQFACIVIGAPPQAIRSRLERRVASGTGASDARWETYVAQKRRFQQPSEVPPERLIVLNAKRRIDGKVADVLRGLREISPLSLQEVLV
jgi:predicted kinase